MTWSPDGNDRRPVDAARFAAAMRASDPRLRGDTGSDSVGDPRDIAAAQLAYARAERVAPAAPWPHSPISIDPVVADEALAAAVGLLAAARRSGWEGGRVGGSDVETARRILARVQLEVSRAGQGRPEAAAPAGEIAGGRAAG
jgi:hypothetical protein